MISKSEQSNINIALLPQLPLSKNDADNNRIRFIVLVLLCCQNSGHALLTRYSQGIRKESYSSTEVVLVAEILKLFVSAYISLKDISETDAVGRGFSKLVWLLIHSQKIVVLVLLYSVANLLAYYALARVEVSVYAVLLQLKILTTAAFSVVYMERNLSGNKWRALLLLVVGCILVASPTFNRSPLLLCEQLLAQTATGGKHQDSSTGQQGAWVDSLEAALGVGAILVMVTITGYSAIYFERMLKKEGERITIWERNFQLAFYSTLLLLGVIVSENFSEMGSNEDAFQLFEGWTVNTVAIALIQAFGGLLVAATLKYADAVLKTLATSGSIVISAVLGYIFLGGTLDLFVSLGALTTILAITNYTLSDASSSAAT